MSTVTRPGRYEGPWCQCCGVSWWGIGQFGHVGHLTITEDIPQGPVEPDAKVVLSKNLCGRCLHKVKAAVEDVFDKLREVQR